MFSLVGSSSLIYTKQGRSLTELFVAMGVMVYALYTYHWRAIQIRRGSREPYDDRLGPVSIYGINFTQYSSSHYSPDTAMCGITWLVQLRFAEFSLTIYSLQLPSSLILFYDLLRVEICQNSTQPKPSLKIKRKI